MDKYKKKIHDFLDKIIDKILPKRILTSTLMFIIGALLYYRFIHEKQISTGISYMIAFMVYILLGLSLYGMFSWFAIKLFQLLGFIFRLIFRGQIQITWTKDKFSSKLIYK